MRNRKEQYGLKSKIDREKVNAIFDVILENFRTLRKLKIEELKVLEKGDILNFNSLGFIKSEIKIEYEYINSVLDNSENLKINSSKEIGMHARKMLMMDMDVDYFDEKKEQQLKVIKKALLDVVFAKLLYNEEKVIDDKKITIERKRELDDVINKTNILKEVLLGLRKNIEKELVCCNVILDNVDDCLKEFGLNGINDWESFVKEDFWMNLDDYNDFVKNFEEREKSWKEFFKKSENFDVKKIEKDFDSKTKDWEKWKS